MQNANFNKPNGTLLGGDGTYYDDVPIGGTIPGSGGQNQVPLPKNNYDIIDDVIDETLNGKGNVTSKYTLTESEALDAGERFLGSGYKEIGKSGSGVYMSQDGQRIFRIDNSSLNGNHAPNVSHFHLEMVQPDGSTRIVNNHIILK